MESAAPRRSIRLLARAAGLVPRERVELSWRYVFPDEEALARAMLAPGPVAEAIVDALAPFRTPAGGYRLENEWHTLVASA